MPYWFDGNNLIGQSAAALSAQPQIRRAFLSTLGACRKSGGGRFLVYFDGDDPHHSMPPSGIRIRYSAPLAADDAIIRRLNEIRSPDEVIVVSNDLELQARCRAAGASVLDWRQFDLKMKSRRTRPKGLKEKEQPVDIEDWMKYFGLDEKN